MSGVLAEIFTDIFKNTISGEHAEKIIDLYLAHLQDPCGNLLVVNLDEVWSMVGFTHKHKVKSLVMRKRFIKDRDYKVIPRFPQRIGPHIDDVVTMTLNTFQAVCVISCTQRGSAVFGDFCDLQRVFFNHGFRSRQM